MFKNKTKQKSEKGHFYCLIQVCFVMMLQGSVKVVGSTSCAYPNRNAKHELIVANFCYRLQYS